MLTCVGNIKYNNLEGIGPRVKGFPGIHYAGIGVLIGRSGCRAACNGCPLDSCDIVSVFSSCLFNLNANISWLIDVNSLDSHSHDVIVIMGLCFDIAIVSCFEPSITLNEASLIDVFDIDSFRVYIVFVCATLTVCLIFTQFFAVLVCLLLVPSVPRLWGWGVVAGVLWWVSQGVAVCVAFVLQPLFAVALRMLVAFVLCLLLSCSPVCLLLLLPIVLVLRVSLAVSVHLFVSRCVHPFVLLCLSVCLSVSLSGRLPVSQSWYPSVFWSVCSYVLRLSVWFCVCQGACPSVIQS